MLFAFELEIAAIVVCDSVKLMRPVPSPKTTLNLHT